MGGYAYAIVRDKKICQEAFKAHGGGKSLSRIEEPEMLGKFLKYCMENSLKIEIVYEDFEDWHEYEYFDDLINKK